MHTAAVMTMGWTVVLPTSISMVPSLCSLLSWHRPRWVQRLGQRRHLLRSSAAREGTHGADDGAEERAAALVVALPAPAATTPQAASSALQTCGSRHRALHTDASESDGAGAGAGGQAVSKAVARYLVALAPVGASAPGGTGSARQLPRSHQGGGGARARVGK